MGETRNPLAPSGDGVPRPEVIDRDALGRFGPGNRAGRGNPHAARVAALRSALLEAVSPDDLRAAVTALVDRAKTGDVAAIRELLDRCVGKVTTPVDIDVGLEAHGLGFVVDDATRRTLAAMLENPVTRDALTSLSEAEAMRQQDLRRR